MTNVKTEDTSDSRQHLSQNSADQATKENDGQDAAGDSEAETLIQSPEKQKNATSNAPIVHSAASAAIRNNRDKGDAADDGKKKTRKRKRDGQTDDQPVSRGSSSSPLSSPNPHAQFKDSDSDVSDTPRSARSHRLRRAAPKAEAEGADGGAPSKMRRRRPSDIVAPPAKQRTKGSGDGTTERRETRSATYPRQSSEERSPSPRPTSRGQHRRGVSTQLTAGELDRKKRGRPPNINTRRSGSLDRAHVASSGDDSSAPVPRPSLEKYDSRDHMSPAKPIGPRKSRDRNGRTLLARACNNDDLDRVRQCLKERPEDLNVVDNAWNSPLQIASLEGFANIVRFLLENGAEVDTRNIETETPLIDAVENGHVEVIKLLLEFGANPRAASKTGDEAYELVPQDDENYKLIRKLIADAKEQDFTKRRKSSDNNNNNSHEGNREGSSRPASAASPRDSPPILGTRSPPANTSRRRTGRSESTRNDLLWQSHTQENLRSLAAKGNVQGVLTILNVLEKAEPAAVIAAAKGGHEEVLSYLLAMGSADPDPEPLPDLKSGYNTPILAALGRGNLDVITLLVNQTGFNPARKHRGKHYFEIAQERRGDGWQKEVAILKEAYEQHVSGQPKTKSPKKVREPLERARQKRTRRSESPPSSSLRNSGSPTTTTKTVPDKSPKTARKDGKKEISSPPERRKVENVKDDNSVAVASDQEQTVHEKRGHKSRRSQSDLPLPPNFEAEITQRRRRLVSGKEHRRSQSGLGGAHSDASGSEMETKRERQGTALKRNRSSVSPELKDGAANRTVAKKRRTVPESSPEDGRPPPQAQQAISLGPKDVEMKTEESESLERISPEMTSQDAAGEPDDTIQIEASDKDVAPSVEVAQPDPAEEQRRQEEQEALQRKAAEDRVTAEQQKAEEEEKAAAERAAAEKAANEKAEADRLAAEKAAAEEAEAQRQAADAAEAKRKAEEAEARRKAEELDAKRRADEDAAARKKEEEERQERQRRELEDRQRRQEEQIRQQHLEIERRRRESLPTSLCTAALFLQTGDPRARSHEWLTRFLPLYTVETRDLDALAPAEMADDKWIPNFQAAVLLATSDLNLRNYTSIEKRPVTVPEQDRLWRLARIMLSYDFYNTNSYNTPIKRAKQIDKEQRPKFMNMTELFWVKVR